MLKKTKTATAKKSPVKKAAAKKNVARPIIKKPAPKMLPVAEPVGKRYITINEYDPQLQKKYRLIAIIIVAAIIFLAVSWFFSLRYNVAETITSIRNGDMQELLDRFKNDQTEKGIDQSDLAAIREEIVKKINESISSSTWPSHQSEILGLSLRYPSNWNKQEIANTLILSSYPLTASAPAVFGQVKIKRLFEKKNSLADYLTTEQESSYQLEASSTPLSGMPALKYVKPNTGTDISWIIIAGQAGKIFEIEFFSKNGQGLYEKLFSEILSTIKF